MLEIFKDVGDEIKYVIDDAKSIMAKGFDDLKKGFKDLGPWLWLRNEADKIANCIYEDTDIRFSKDTLDDICEEMCNDYCMKKLTTRRKRELKDELEKRILNYSTELIFTWYDLDGHKSYSK